MRAAISARYSSDNQQKTSCDDQINAGRELAQRNEWQVVREYRDEAVSGYTPAAARAGTAQMLADAKAGVFDILILWDLKRLSRGEDLPMLLARLKFLGIRVVTCNGYDSSRKGAKQMEWVEGLLGNSYLEQLAEDTHRGLSGQFDRGMFAGGMAYGYTTIETPQGQQIQIDPEEAKWVLWIFEKFSAGLSPRAIAHELNRMNVKGPRGSTWATSGLYGSPRKGTGILNNELYIGRYIWNRSRWSKNPDTGIRKRIERPRTEWKISDRPELRIVNDTLWNAARARLKPTAISRGRPASSILAGLLRCAYCKGTMVCTGAGVYGCYNRKERGLTVCQGMYVKRDETELRILSAIRDNFMTPYAIAQLRKILSDRAAARNDRKDLNQDAWKRRLGQLEREISNLTNAIADVGLLPTLKERLLSAEAEQAKLRLELGPDKPDEQIPALMVRYKKLLAALPDAIGRRPDKARAALKLIADRIQLDVEGDAVYADIGVHADRILLAAGDKINVVAGAGFILYRRIRVR